MTTTDPTTTYYATTRDAYSTPAMLVAPDGTVGEITSRALTLLASLHDFDPATYA